MAKQETVLVVDDEAVIRELMVDILTEQGYPVKSASAPLEALDMLRLSDEFVVLFTDIMMPGMDGITLVREAKKIRPVLIPIVMTGYATLDTARAAVKEGAYDYVLKPFSLNEVKLAVANALERHRLMTENTRLREITELFRISEAIATMRDERELVGFILNAALDKVGAKRGSLMMATPDGKALELVASVGLPREAANSVVSIGSGISGWVAKNVQPLLVEDIRRNPLVEKLGHQLSDPSFISVPLERKHEPVGREMVGDMSRVVAVLNVTEKKDGSQFTDADLKILSIVANHAAAALENVKLIQDIQDAHVATLQSMALLLEAKDSYTSGHTQRVCEYSLLAARKLGIAEGDLKVLSLGATLHDIGKVGVKDDVLNKPDRLTTEEFNLIKRHPIIGYDVLEPVHMLSKEHLHVVRAHHERIDGTGYPDRLEGDQISILTRIVAVADSYDAMSSNRAYRTARPEEAIVEQLEAFSGTQFDPGVARIFIELIRKGEIGRQEA